MELGAAGLPGVQEGLFGRVILGFFRPYRRGLGGVWGMSQPALTYLLT